MASGASGARGARTLALFLHKPKKKEARGPTGGGVSCFKRRPRSDSPACLRAGWLLASSRPISRGASTDPLEPQKSLGHSTTHRRTALWIPVRAMLPHALPVVSRGDLVLRRCGLTASAGARVSAARSRSVRFQRLVSMWSKFGGNGVRFRRPQLFFCLHSACKHPRGCS